MFFIYLLIDHEILLMKYYYYLNNKILFQLNILHDNILMSIYIFLFNNEINNPPKILILIK